MAFMKFNVNLFSVHLGFSFAVIKMLCTKHTHTSLSTTTTMTNVENKTNKGAKKGKNTQKHIAHLLVRY